jgi:hypothetical protein
MKKSTNAKTNDKLAKILQDLKDWNADMGGYDINITLSTGYNDVNVSLEGGERFEKIVIDNNGFKTKFPKTDKGCLRAAKSINQAVRDNNRAGEMDA